MTCARHGSSTPYTYTKHSGTEQDHQMCQKWKQNILGRHTQQNNWEKPS